jgi:hypothetical protein
MGIIPVVECFEVPLRLKEKLGQAEGTRWARGGSQQPREQRRTRPMLLMMRVVTMMQMRFAFLRIYCRWYLKPASRLNRKKSKRENTITACDKFWLHLCCSVPVIKTTTTAAKKQQQHDHVAQL